MAEINFKSTVLLLLFIGLSCLHSKPQSKRELVTEGSLLTQPDITLGISQTALYFPHLKNKRIGIATNHSSLIFKEGKPQHLVDFLIANNFNVTTLFAPEHGFRGTADAGKTIENQTDAKTGLPIISLYGKHKKPLPTQLKNIDILVFDIQDVGVRFYTYISTLHYLLEACAENQIPIIVLDRPNPNAHYIDGPVLETAHQSFVGMHPVPVVYGMTIGEYARMIVGENWLSTSQTPELTVIPLKNYNHKTPYNLPVKPSPNLPNARAVNLYPSLCFFEGTPISAGRGTSLQFQVFGAPQLPDSLYNFSFTPKPNIGAQYPKFNGEVCVGKNLENTAFLSEINLEWLIEAYSHWPVDNPPFFNAFFTKLAGTHTLQKQIENGYTAKAIKASWQDALNTFKNIRTKYLLYPED